MHVELREGKRGGEGLQEEDAHDRNSRNGPVDEQKQDVCWAMMVSRHYGTWSP